MQTSIAVVVFCCC